MDVINILSRWDNIRNLTKHVKQHNQDHSTAVWPTYLTVIDASRPVARVGARVDLLDVADGPAVGPAEHPGVRAGHVVPGRAEPAPPLRARHEVPEVAVRHHRRREAHEAAAGGHARRVDVLESKWKRIQG